MKRRQSKYDRHTYTPSLICEQKQVYQSEALALDAADFRMREHLSLELKVYRCSNCQLWHLTTKQA